jgi:hypothetical protein
MTDKPFLGLQILAEKQSRKTPGVILEDELKVELNIPVISAISTMDAVPDFPDPLDSLPTGFRDKNEGGKIRSG